MSWKRCEKHMYILVLIPFFVLLSVPLRILIKKFKHIIPQNFFLLVIGMLTGIMVSTVVKLNKYYCIVQMSPHEMISVFVPIFLVSTLHRIDHYILLRCIFQVLVICLFGIIFSPVAMAYFIATVLHPEWPLERCIPFALLSLPIEPQHVVRILKDLAKYKYLGTLLEAESIIVFIPLMIYYKLLDRVDVSEMEWYTIPINVLIILSGGILIGCTIGKVQSYLICYFYNDPIIALSISIATTYLAYFVADAILSTSGATAVICQIWFTSEQKHRLSSEVDAFLAAFWNAIHYITEIIMLMIGACQLTGLIMKNFTFHSMYSTVVMYITGLTIRLMRFLILLPVLKRLNNELNLKCMLVLSWSDIKGPMSILFVLYIISREGTIMQYKSYMNEVLWYVFLNFIVNCTSMRLLLNLIGLSELSMSRYTNMNNCMKYVSEKRVLIMDSLKLARYLSNANWMVIRAETVLQNPYLGMYNDLDYDEDDIARLGDTIVCTDCKREVPLDFTEAELNELLKETKYKLLKAKKVCFIKQYEVGTIDKNSLQALVRNTEIMLESSKKISRLRVSKYMNQYRFLKVIRKAVQHCVVPQRFKVPRAPYKRICFYITQHILYDFGLYLIAIVEGVLLGLFYFYKIHRMYQIFPIGIYLIDFTLKVIGLSNESFPKSGIVNYFSVKSHIVDFILLIIEIILFVAFVILECLDINEDEIKFDLYLIYVMARLFNIFRLLSSMAPYIIRNIDYRRDKRIYFGYCLASALYNCNEELLSNLTYLIDNKIAREYHRSEIIAERNHYIHTMDDVQRSRAWIAITVKTKRALRIALTAMENTLKQLQTSGFIDNVEYVIINKELFKNQKNLRNIKFVQPRSPKVIFKDVPWLANLNEDIVEFLYKNVQTVTWDAGQMVLEEGMKSNGVYILVTGMLRLQYVPKTDHFQDGLIPIVDYLYAIEGKECTENIVVSGDTIGELSVLTGRTYDCKLVAESPSQAYWLPAEVLKEAMKMSKHPIYGLEASMWKASVMNLAIAILMDTPQYAKSTQEEIKIKLQRSFMPNLRCYKIFVITEQMEDLILIEGRATNYINEEVYVAPMCIPLISRRLIFPWSTGRSAENQIQTRLLIVPSQDVPVVELMEKEERIGVLNSDASSDCLLNAKETSSEIRMKQMKRRKTQRIISTDSASMARFNVSDDKEIIVLDSQEYVPSVASKYTEETSEGIHGRGTPLLLLNRKISKRQSEED